MSTAVKISCQELQKKIFQAFEQKWPIRPLIIQGQKEITEFHTSNRQNNYLRLNLVYLFLLVFCKKLLSVLKGEWPREKRGIMDRYTNRTWVSCQVNMSASNPPGKVNYFCDVSYDTVAMMKLQFVSFRGWLNLSLNKIKGQKYHWLVTAFLSWIHPFSFANGICI